VYALVRHTALLLALLLTVHPPGWAQVPDVPQFTDVTVEAGLNPTHRAAADAMRMGIGTGAAWFDYDRDGDLDLYLTQGEGPNALYRNNGDATFTDVAEALGAADAAHAGAGVAVADYDNDGWPDLYLANSDADVLLQNQGGSGFTDATAAGELPADERARGTSASWGDYDQDGFVDLYVTNHMDLRGLSYSSQDRLYHNNGDGTFADASTLLGLDRLNGYGFIGAWTDYDYDGDADLLLVNDCPFGEAGRYQPTYLFRNDGGPGPLAWIFTEVSARTGADHCRHGMGLAAGDYNRDGRADYFYTNIGRRTTLLTNHGDQFTERAEEAGVLVGYDPRTPGGPFLGTFSWGASFFDYDRDGWQDLFVAAGTLSLDVAGATDPQPNVLFHNDGAEAGQEPTFTDVSAMSGLDLPERSRTSITGDYDNDGDLDLLVVSVGESVRLYRNDTDNGRHYLTVTLEGRASNRDGIGAWLTLTTPDGAEQHAEVRSGSSLGGEDARSVFFGLGEHATIASLRVRWPSGREQTLTGLVADQPVEVVEPETTTAFEKDAVPIQEGFEAVYPNPSYAGVQVIFRLARPAEVTFGVYDVLGRAVFRDRMGYHPPGLHHLGWNGIAGTGQRVPPGLYVVRLTAGTHTWSRMLTHLPSTPNRP
jgi:hypothetical protein